MDDIREKHLLCRTALWSFSKLSKQEDAKSSFFLQNQARTIQTHKTVFENSFLAMFISQVSSKLRDKHCQVTRISSLPKRNFQTLFYGSVYRVCHYTSVLRGIYHICHIFGIQFCKQYTIYLFQIQV